VSTHPRAFSRQPALCVLAFVPVLSLAASNTGREFYIGFMPHHESQSHSLQLAAGNAPATGVIEIPGAAPIPFSLAANGNARIQLMSPVHNSVPDSIAGSAVHVSSSAPIVVVAANGADLSLDTALVLPVDAWGVDYHVMSRPQAGGSPSQFAVVASVDGTLVHITPMVATGVRDGSPYSVTLNRGETYLLQTDNEGESLAGTRIEAEQPIAVFAGNQCHNDGDGGSLCSHLFEQLMPATAAGMRFFVTPTGSPMGTRIVVFALEPTVLTTDPFIPGLSTSIGPGGVMTGELPANIPVQIVTNAPVFVAQFPRNGSAAGSDMTMVPALENFQRSQMLVPLSGGGMQNFANLVIAATDAPNCTVNGLLLGAGGAPIGTSGYLNVQLNLGQAPAFVVCPQPFGAIVHGREDSAESPEFRATYGHPGGLFLPTSSTPVSNAGPDVTGDERSVITLDGSASQDPAGGALTYQWSQISPVEPVVVLDLANPARPRFVAPEVVQQTDLTFSLVVSNASGATSSPDLVRARIYDLGPPPPPPVVGCASPIVTIAGLSSLVNQLRTSRQTIALLDATLKTAQTALTNNRKALARTALALFLDEVVVAANLDPRLPGRVPIEDANELTCGAANVITRIAPR